MLKKTIRFKDLDGNEIVDDFYFNVNKAEIVEMEVDKPGGFTEYIKRLNVSRDGAEIMAIFKDIIVKSVGRRSEDGRRFIKSQEIIDDFTQSNAYSEMFMELVTNAEAGAEFVRAVLPADLAQQMEGVSLPTLDQAQTPEEPAWIRENRDPTQDEVKSMTQEQLAEAFRKKMERAQQPTVAD